VFVLWGNRPEHGSPTSDVRHDVLSYESCIVGRWKILPVPAHHISTRGGVRRSGDRNENLSDRATNRKGNIDHDFHQKKEYAISSTISTVFLIYVNLVGNEI
jgi:hypothetical protein